MRHDLLRFAAELAKQGEAFVLATVVRREAPSSARVGDTALVTEGGAFHGWVGGSCTQPTVVKEALRALADRVPRLIARLRAHVTHALHRLRGGRLHPIRRHHPGLDHVFGDRT